MKHKETRPMSKKTGGEFAPNSKKWRTVLKVVSYLFLVMCVFGLIICSLASSTVATTMRSEEALAMLYESGIDQGQLGVTMTVSLVIMAAESLLQAGAFVLGIRTLKGKARPESCQIMGILLVGAAAVSAMATGLTSSFDSTLVASLAASLILPVVYYVAAHRIAKDTFWQGIKKYDQDEEESRKLEEREIVTEEEISAALRSFVLDGRVQGAHSDAQILPGEQRPLPTVEIVSLDGALAMENPRLKALAQDRSLIRHCRAEAVAGCVVGTLSLPRETFQKWPPSSEATRMEAMFMLAEGKLVFATDDKLFPLLFNDYVAHQAFDKQTPAAVFSEFLEFIIRDDLEYLIDLQERLDRLEENMSEDVNEIPKDFDDYVMDVRKTLRTLMRFYKQYSDMARVVSMVRGFEMAEEDRELFAIVADRADRLSADAQDLFEYALQIKNLYQSKIDVRQGKVMQILTIVTSIFMPLTLVTGWYGMNFDNMPELHWRFSYFGIIAIVVAVVTAEVVIFKRKKWF